ncbi:MAG: hypothetical protein IKJ65_04820 [Clostridia bacterium]|nr:hypothetical protein [Clostridia bacterium]
MRIIKNEGVFRLGDRNTTLILTDEKQLARIAENPDLPLYDDEERGFSGEKKGIYPPGTTLNSFMKDAYERHCTRVEVSYDFFFGGSKRENYPDDELTMRAYKVISDCAKKYGMTFGASALSPLDIGGGYAKRHDDIGYTWQMEETAIENGEYQITCRRQRQWYNNKGPIQLKLNRVMAVAFDETTAMNGWDLVVDPEAIADISETARYEVMENTAVLTGGGYGYDLINVFGKTDADKKRVLILLEYATPEQDYFTPDAIDFVKNLMDKYNEMGVQFKGFYSDEMHIQFDWDLEEHFGPTEIRTRYVTDSLIKEYARRFGDEYLDFVKYMVYFAYTKHEDGSFRNHLMADGKEGVYKTVLFRKRYFEMLSRRIVDLAVEGKEYAESLFGSPIMTVAHATWQESPTCDHFSDDFAFSQANRREVCRYDYDKPYVWSSTIRENMSACGDYFRWNEFLTGSGTDHPEGGNTDRNYYAQAFAASLGTLNKFEHAYCASWGSPKPVIDRFTAVGNTYGTAYTLGDHMLVQNMRTRLSDVLMLYPTELNYAEERFGSWMVQYGYCDYITEEKLLQHATPTDDGYLHVNGKKYRAVVALFEPFVDEVTLAMLIKFACAGGKVVWAGPAALNFEDGHDSCAEFMETFGLKNVASLGEGLKMADKFVSFDGALKGVAPMEIRTDLLPDYVYPVEVSDAQVVARVDGKIVGAVAKRGLGSMCYLGFRPRDDQSVSTGKDVSTLFDILCALDAYGEESLEKRSRPESSRYLMNVFENGAIAVSNHYRTFQEDWYGSFFRDEEEDKRLLTGRELPPYEIELENEVILGKTVSYKGEGCMTFNTDRDGNLVGFAGENTRGVTVDGREFSLYSENAKIMFAVMDKSRISDGLSGVMLLRADRPGVFTVPAPEGFENAKAAFCTVGLIDADTPVDVKIENGVITLEVTQDMKDKFIGVYA